MRSGAVSSLTGSGPPLIAAAALAVLLVDRSAQGWISGSDYRGTRASAQVSSGASELGARAKDVVVTTFGLFATDSNGPIMVLGVVASVAMLALGVMVARRSYRGSTVRILVVIVAVLVTLQIAIRGFVPGLLPAAPVAAAGVWGVRRRFAAAGALQVIAIGSLVSLPVVWALEWVGNLTAQWGGRYVLVAAALLTTVGSATIARGQRELPSGFLLLAAVAIGASGLVWHVERTIRYAHVIEDIEALPCNEVLVVTAPYLLREGGSFDLVRIGGTDECRYLSAFPNELHRAL